jgi:Protein of unknown function (DUF2723)
MLPRSLVFALAALSLAAHLAVLPPALEDIDSVNFAMGVRDFDVARHQPHPPGYPAYIGLGKAGTAILTAMGVAPPDVAGLAIWSAIGGAALTVLLFAFFKSLDDAATGRAVMAAVLGTCCPLVWFNSARPMSDIAGLAVAFGALAALRRPRTLLLGAFLAGLAIGFRSQMALLTAPMLVFALLLARRRIAVIGAAAFGVAIWAIPLVFLSGGPAGYLRALGSQAGEDFTGVVMLWTHPTPRVAVEAVLYTFARPWDWPVLAGVMLSLAAAGAWLLLIRSRRTLGLLLLAFAPYAVFHLLFQEPLTTRYALPLVPLLAYLVATVLSEARPRVAAIGTAALAVAGLVFAMPATTAFGRETSPVFAMLSEMRMLQERGASPTIGMHRRVFTESRRARAYAGEVPGKILPAPRDYEWLEMTRAWRAGADGETWFIADPRRTDLALIDRAHTRTREYRWPFASALYAGGTRPNEIDWHIFNAPGWFLEEGWALTPETAGIADRDGWGPHRRPSVGWVRRRPTESLIMIGGRHLGGDSPVSVSVHIDDRQTAALTVRPGFFLDFVTVPAGALNGAGTYAKLTVSASAANAPTPPVAIEQFNIQPADRVLFGFDEGWFEPEYNPGTAKSWRWMTNKAVVSVRHAGRPVTMRVTGESPLHYFDDSPVVRVSVADRTLTELRPNADFTTTVDIPADLLAAAGGRVVISSDRTFVAGEREGTADRRKLALRIYSVTVE